MRSSVDDLQGGLENYQSAGVELFGGVSVDGAFLVAAG